MKYIKRLWFALSTIVVFPTISIIGSLVFIFYIIKGRHDNLPWSLFKGLKTSFKIFAGEQNV